MSIKRSSCVLLDEPRPALDSVSPYSFLAFLKKTVFPLPAQVPLSRLVVPMLLALGWIVGCALMVYIVFS